MSDARDDIDLALAILDDTGSLPLPTVRDYLAELRRLRALLTAPPDDDEIAAASWRGDMTRRQTMADAVAAAFACRARKISGDTDE